MRTRTVLVCPIHTLSSVLLLILLLLFKASFYTECTSLEGATANVPASGSRAVGENPCLHGDPRSPACVGFLARARGWTWNETRANIELVQRLLEPSLLSYPDAREPHPTLGSNRAWRANGVSNDSANESVKVLVNVAIACLARAGQLPVRDGGCVRCKKLYCSSMWADVEFCALYCPLSIGWNGTKTSNVPEKTALLEQSTSEHNSNQSVRNSGSFKNRTAEYVEVSGKIKPLWQSILVTAAFAISLSFVALLIIGTVGIVASCIERCRGTKIKFYTVSKLQNILI